MMADPLVEAEELIELTAQIDHENPDYTQLDEAIESVTNPWEVLRNVLRRAHSELL